MAAKGSGGGGNTVCTFCGLRYAIQKGVCPNQGAHGPDPKPMFRECMQCHGSAPIDGDCRNCKQRKGADKKPQCPSCKNPLSLPVNLCSVCGWQQGYWHCKGCDVWHPATVDACPRCKAERENKEFREDSSLSHKEDREDKRQGHEERRADKLADHKEAREDARCSHEEARADAEHAHKEAREDALAAHKEAREDARQAHQETREDAKVQAEHDRKVNFAHCDVCKREYPIADGGCKNCTRECPTCHERYPRTLNTCPHCPKPSYRLVVSTTEGEHEWRNKATIYRELPGEVAKAVPGEVEAQDGTFKTYPTSDQGVVIELPFERHSRVAKFEIQLVTDGGVSFNPNAETREVPLPGRSYTKCRKPVAPDSTKGFWGNLLKGFREA